MRDLLHDRIDEEEELADKARELAADTVRGKLGDAIEASGGDVEAALLVVAALVGNGLADITTESVRRGYDYAKRRARYVQDSKKA